MKTIVLPIFVIFTTIQAVKKVPLHTDGQYNKTVTVSVNNQNEYTYWFPSLKSENPCRISVKTDVINNNFPLMIVVTQEKEITSWKIPLVVNSKSNHYMFYQTARTLCYSSVDFFHTFYRSPVRSLNEADKKFSITFSTFAPSPIEVTFIAKEFKDYYIKEGVNYTVKVSPSEPSYYYFSFFANKIAHENIFINIDSNDDQCVVVSLQKSLCPVNDLNDDITYEGNYLTMTRRGSLYTRKKFYPEGFFLVFVVRSDNYECSGENTILPPYKDRALQVQKRESILHFKITRGISNSDVQKAILSILGFYIGFAILCIALTCGIYLYKNRHKDEVDSNEEGSNIEGAALTTYKEIDIKLNLLDTKPTNKKKASNYFYHIANIGLFYGLPVIQLMFSYQRTVRISGDQDICYHNFMCAHPVFGMNDFNHIYSNIGYLIMGLLFIVLVRAKQRTTKCAPSHGIPKYYGLFYAMGIGLILEGFLSGCYHICPNQMNFQFDTSFMYTMAILIMIKLYQNRHPDINASAYASFTVLGLAVLIAMIGIMTNSIVVLILFVICYLFLCLYISFKIYCFGYILKTLGDVYTNVKTESFTLQTLNPLRKRLFIILLLANIINYTVAGLGVYFYPDVLDFGTYLLMLLMCNAVLHMAFYIGMKLHCRESLCVEAIVYGILALCCWIPSAYFFFNASTLWTVTPAESRQMNTECIFMQFFDGHDIWHMLSALGLFFSFMLLLTVDDNLNEKHKKEIPVF